MANISHQFLDEGVLQHGCCISVSPGVCSDASVYLQFQQGLHQRIDGGVGQRVTHRHVECRHLTDAVENGLQQFLVAENNSRLAQGLIVLEMLFCPFANVSGLCIICGRLDEGDAFPLLHIFEHVHTSQLITQLTDVFQNELPRLIFTCDAFLSVFRVGFVIIPIELGIAVLLDVLEQFQFRLVQHIEPHHHISLRGQSFLHPLPFLPTILVGAHEGFHNGSFHQTFIHHRLVVFRFLQRPLVAFVYLGHVVPQRLELAFQLGV